MIPPGSVPKRIVLSRKGFDSSWGGCASPILDYEMISLPIPEHNLNYRKSLFDGHCPENHLTYQDLKTTSEGKRAVELVLKLTKGIKESDCVHLDPDIRPGFRKREDMSSPLTFGQSGGSQTELNKIEEGDLFLFFGWFRDALADSGIARFDKKGSDMHVIWGWLQVSERLDLPSKLSRAREIARHHPHVTHHVGRHPNCLYVAGNSLAFLPSYPGAGAFSRFHDGLSLSDLKSESRPRKRSHWRLPAFFKEMSISRIRKISDWTREGDSIVGEAANHPGQEFIFETNGHEVQVANWLEGIFHGVGQEPQ